MKNEKKTRNEIKCILVEKKLFTRPTPNGGNIKNFQY